MFGRPPWSVSHHKGSVVYSVYADQRKHSSIAISGFSLNVDGKIRSGRLCGIFDTVIDEIPSHIVATNAARRNRRRLIYVSLDGNLSSCLIISSAHHSGLYRHRLAPEQLRRQSLSANGFVAVIDANLQTDSTMIGEPRSRRVRVEIRNGYRRQRSIQAFLRRMFPAEYWPDQSPVYRDQLARRSSVDPDVDPLHNHTSGEAMTRALVISRSFSHGDWATQPRHDDSACSRGENTSMPRLAFPSEREVMKRQLPKPHSHGSGGFLVLMPFNMRVVS
ncbi:uncharacterized protein LAESUDRAFT_717093 [Laetiporus sulphureus 93-53]|uniref:Uncharacterized protein n=1 Tax=Laetiporus sulphureus 93-53 TaxID=1314785 RepID=A0A165C1U9_9APHY|nr:uncharacterized protein LAESUDRAFT_717093 [Laetiporus sulphureus 93-53]KZT02049.1 hypothetical protein LAESUDRAFT_717093 [Laetiporus sulphureus 93-53]